MVKLLINTKVIKNDKLHTGIEASDFSLDHDMS